jgi:outer membrane protein TolC
MTRWIAFAFLAIPAVLAAQAPETTDLPSREAVARWLQHDPSLQEAESDRVTARHEAGMLRASPNEWIVTATGQRRRYDVGGTSREWNAGIERTIRLPGKRALDTRLGENTEAIAEARHDETLLQALNDLVDLWLSWSAAAEERRLVDEQADLARANRGAVEKRVKAGDAARLDLNLAEADLADIDRLGSEARTAEAQAKARLNVRFAELPAEAPRLSLPAALEESPEALKAKLISRSPTLQVADAELNYADVAVSRERADRLPDPTLGVFNASEAFGNERIVGFSLSVPLPGAYRTQKLGRALSVRDKTEAALSRERQRIEADSAAQVLEAQGRVDSWRLARSAAERARENARLTQRAYALGEADLQTLLLARRQSLDATRTAVQAQFAALKARYQVSLAVGELWGDLTSAGSGSVEPRSTSSVRLPAVQ